jgi:predicted branched-subunit amino acid permease
MKSSYWRGVRDGLPFLMVVGPFAMLFGVLATEAGLSLVEALGFSVVVIAGAAQFTALQLMTEEAPTLIVIVSALAVNLRMAMYSASITPHLGGLSLGRRVLAAYFLVDQTYAAAALEYERRPAMTQGERFAYFMGVATPICPPWYGFTLLGALVGETVPADLGLDFVLPLAFLAMLGPALRTGAHRIAALVAGVAALAFAGLPYNLGLIVAAACGMLAGAEAERRAESRAVAHG